MYDIFVTSDTHFCHNKDFLYAKRGFSNIDDMNEAIVTNWNSLVKKNDTVYHLGDVMLSNNDKGLELFESLNGNIHLILGNHDTDERVGLFMHCRNVVDISYADRFKYNGYHFFFSHYPTLTSTWDYAKPLKQRLVSLCGHVHTLDKFHDWDKGPIYHCELDAHNCMPISLDCILEDVIKKGCLALEEKSNG